MKYEIKLVYKDRILSPVEVFWQSLVPEERLDYVIRDYEAKAIKIVKDYSLYDAWIQINRMSDTGEFIEVVR